MTLRTAFYDKYERSYGPYSSLRLFGIMAVLLYCMTAGARADISLFCVHGQPAISIRVACLRTCEVKWAATTCPLQTNSTLIHVCYMQSGQIISYMIWTCVYANTRFWQFCTECAHLRSPIYASFFTGITPPIKNPLLFDYRIWY